MKTGSTGKRRGQEPPVCTCSACNHCLALGQVSDARLRTWGQEVPRGGWEHPSSFPANRRNTTACAWTLAASSRAGRCRPSPSTRLASPSAEAGGWGSVSPLGRAQVTPKGSPGLSAGEQPPSSPWVEEARLRTRQRQQHLGAPCGLSLAFVPVWGGGAWGVGCRGRGRPRQWGRVQTRQGARGAGVQVGASRTWERTPSPSPGDSLPSLRHLDIRSLPDAPLTGGLPTVGGSADPASAPRPHHGSPSPAA